MSLETPKKIRDLQIKLYRKAKNEPEYRFYELYDKVSREDILLHAYARAKANNGTPGVDEESFEDIETRGREEWLNGLRKELHDKTYKPQPVRTKDARKPGGGQRPLGIPTIRDRVAQTAAKLVLEPICEADLEPNVHGYRPGRSAADAIQKVDELLQAGYRDVVDADLSKYFDTIPHTELMQCVARRIVDRQMLHLIQMWLKVPVEERDEETGKVRRTGGKDNDRGTPQGGVVSPGLAESVYEPDGKGISANQTGGAVSGADSELRGRLRDPERWQSEGGTGVGAGSADAVGIDAERKEDEHTKCPAGAIRFSGVHIRAAHQSADWEAVHRI